MRAGRSAASRATAGGTHVETEFGVAGEAFGVHAGKHWHDDVDLVMDPDVGLVGVGSQ